MIWPIALKVAASSSLLVVLFLALGLWIAADKKPDQIDSNKALNAMNWPFNVAAVVAMISLFVAAAAWIWGL